MFTSEVQLQELIHSRPEVILSGIPEINPAFCPDTPRMVSLGRELPLSSGFLDNLFIDSNAILTFVECKLHSNPEIKREVYSQAVNYASNLQTQLMSFEGDVFFEELTNILNKGYQSPYQNAENFDQILNYLSEDTILLNKDKAAWKHQFYRRLEQNIKAGICRIIILCGSSRNKDFAYQAIRNLVQIMNFSERPNSSYDLILMDCRAESVEKAPIVETDTHYITRIIWRSYTQLPQIPLIAAYSKNTAASIEAMQALIENFEAEKQDALIQFREALHEIGIVCKENTAGYSLQWSENGKALYIAICIKENAWDIVRHQIRFEEELYKSNSSYFKDIVPLQKVDFSVEEKTSAVGNGTMYHIRITPHYPFDAQTYADAILPLAYQN